MSSARRGSHRRITVECESRIAPDCKSTWAIEERLANETRSKNAGKVICIRCSIALKRSGRTNPNARYTTLDDGFFETIESEAKAYLLGWLASDGAIKKGSIALYVHSKDAVTLSALRDAICRPLPIRPKKNTPLVGFTINSQRIVKDVCRWLQIEPGRKSQVVGFADLQRDDLRWAFLRGIFDGDGSISSIDAAQKRSSWPTPRCSLACTSERFIEAVVRFTAIPCYRHAGGLEWSGANALDFLGKLYGGAAFRLGRKWDLYLDWCCWMPALMSGNNRRGTHPLFRWARTAPNAFAPSKNAVSDSGFDLTLIERSKVHGAVEFYRTGIKIQPAFGWYFDLVPRSSISKSGYMLANSVGVIDRGYTGEVLVPLVKIDPAAPPLPLPSRLVQIIPRQIIAAELVEVEELDDTVRGDGGFGSTG